MQPFPPPADPPDNASSVLILPLCNHSLLPQSLLIILAVCWYCHYATIPSSHSPPGNSSSVLILPLCNHSLLPQSFLIILAVCWYCHYAIIKNTAGCQDSLFVRAPGSWSKGCEFESQLERWDNFLCQCHLCVLRLIRCPFPPSPPPSFTTVARKRPRSFCHSAKSAGGRLHLNMRTPLTQWSRSGLTMPRSRHSVGTYQVTSLHATCQGTLGHRHLSSLSHCRPTLA